MSAKTHNYMTDDGVKQFVLHSDYAALLARHNALREAVHKAMGRTADCDKKQTDDQLIADVAYLKRLASDYFKTSVYCGNRALAAEQEYDALREAVEWERECEEFDPFWPVPSAISASWLSRNSESWRSKQAARAEVDRLIANASAADCEGEG